jgi:type II secretory pathway predicted ATPase ExeA
MVSGMNLHQLLEHTDRPFLSHPQLAKYFPAASIEDARRRLGRSIERGEGPGVVVGAAGTGKSMLLQVLAAQYHERFDVVLLACAQMHTRRGLLQAIHFELGLDHQQRDEGELRLSLLDHLLSAESSAHALLLLVDEAQALPTQLIEEIRILSNLARNGSPRVRVVLAGLPSLEEKLASPELESFSQRLAARCSLAPFARAETNEYVQAQVAICGAEPKQVFAADAWDVLFDITDGVPRLVNQLCDRAMLLADERKAAIVSGSIIQNAWADLQQLPSSFDTAREIEPQRSNAPVVVEFGTLSSDIRCETDQDATYKGPACYSKAPDEALRFEAAITSAKSKIDDHQASPPAAEQRFWEPPASKHRPRTLDDCVPVAVDPFADQFEEEEVVLDRCTLLSEMFHAKTPRVQNHRDPAFTRRVSEALRSQPTPSAMRRKEPENPEFIGPPAKSDSNSFRISEEKRSRTIRLAVVDDLEQLEPAPFRSLPSVASKYELSLPAVESAGRIEDPILVIEDEPVQPQRSQSGVRREAYRDLFSRLRHGT